MDKLFKQAYLTAVPSDFKLNTEKTIISKLYLYTCLMQN